MDLTGEQRISATREQVWEALNDLDVLKACIPGCETIEWSSANELEAIVTAKVGPVKARFGGRVTLTNIDPPNGYTISGEGKGGAAGFARGGADVALATADGGTLLTYSVKAQVGGKLAQVGARLILATAKKMSDDFFKVFSAQVMQRTGGAPAPVVVPETKARRLPLWVWASGLSALVLLVLAYWAGKLSGG